MNWMESIRINFGGGIRGLKDLGGMEMLEEQLSAVPRLSWECYQNMAVPGDLCLVLQWEGEPPPAMESDLALQLVREFNRRGLVSHTAWISTREPGASASLAATGLDDREERAWPL